MAWRQMFQRRRQVRNTFKHYLKIQLLPRRKLGRDSSVSIGTSYGLDGPGIESWWMWDFPYRPDRLWGPPNPPVKWVPGLFPGGKADGTRRRPPAPSSAEVKERVQLYLYSPSRPSKACCRVTFTFTRPQGKYRTSLIKISVYDP